MKTDSPTLKPVLISLLISSSLLIILFIQTTLATAEMKLKDVPTGGGPKAVAANHLTNKIYVANYLSHTVTIINGVDHSTNTVAVGLNPNAIIANLTSDEVYVTNEGDNTLTIIDGADYSTTTLNVGGGPAALTLNPVSNKLYVANVLSHTVSVIDGGAYSQVTVNVGLTPTALAVNPETNQVYVTNTGDNTVSVIDGDDNSVTTIDAGGGPGAIALNPATNKIYVTNYLSHTVTVIDGLDNSTDQVNTGLNPTAVVVNPMTNKIYVANEGSNSVTVINGMDNSTTSIAVGNGPGSIALNAVTHKLAVVNASDNTVTLIDGPTETADTTLSTGDNPGAVAINPITNKFYIPNTGSNSVTVIDAAENKLNAVQVYATYTIPVDTAINIRKNEAYLAHVEGVVTVIDETDFSTDTIQLSNGWTPSGGIVNPISNKAYFFGWPKSMMVIDRTNNQTKTINEADTRILEPVTNKIYGSDTGRLTFLDGRTDTYYTTTIYIGEMAILGEANPDTNKVYFVDASSSDVIVFDATTNNTSTISIETSPSSALTKLAVNPISNKVYVLDSRNHRVFLINGLTEVTETINVGQRPSGIAINPITNKIYIGSNQVANNDEDITIIDGPTNNTTTLNFGPNFNFGDIATNPTTNKIYITHLDNPTSTLTILDGTDYSITGINSIPGAGWIGINPKTNKIYIQQWGYSTITLLSEQHPQTNPLTLTITSLPDDTSPTKTPTFTFSPHNAYSTTVQQVYYQVDTWIGPWLPASQIGQQQWLGTTPPLHNGIHTLFAFAGDGQEATSANPGGSPIIGEIAAYLFLVAEQPGVGISKTALPPLAGPGQPITYSLNFFNTGALTASNLTISDSLPALVTGPSVISSGALITQTGSQPYVWQVGSVEPGASGFMTITGLISPDVGADLVFTNTAHITGSGVSSGTAHLAAAAPIMIEMPRMAFQQGSQTVPEAAGTANIPVTLSKPPYVQTTASYSGPGISGVIAFSPGTTVQTIALPITDDQVAGPDQTLVLSLGNPSRAILGSPPTTTLTLIDDDTAGVIITPTNLSLGASDSEQTYEVVLASQPTAVVTVSAMITAPNLVLSPGGLTFDATNWSVSQTFVITPINTLLPETPQVYLITHTIASSDPVYNGITASTVAVTLTGNSRSLYLPLLLKQDQ